MIRPTTKHQISRAQKDKENRTRLLELGWYHTFDQIWFGPKKAGGVKYGYDFKTAVELEKLRGNLGPRGKNLKLKKTGKKLKQDLTGT